MTRNELVSAYQRGRIDRRAFIKGMAALGMSLTVATSMADKLRAAPAPKGSFSGRFLDDSYDDIYDDEEDPVIVLPSTGIGEQDSGRSWGPAAVIGGAAAVIATRIRRSKPSETS